MTFFQEVNDNIVKSTIEEFLKMNLYAQKKHWKL